MFGVPDGVDHTGPMLFGRSIPVPEAVGAALELLFGESIGHVRVIEYSLFARLHVTNNATTRWQRNYLRGSAADFFKNPSLMLHGYCHVPEQREPEPQTGENLVCRLI